MFSKELFGQRIQEIRKLHNETQKELGVIIGTRPNNVSDLESGKRTTTSENIAKICRHYHVSPRGDVSGGQRRTHGSPAGQG